MKLNKVEKIDNYVTVKNILVSVADKRYLDSFIPDLLSIDHEMRIYSTGGTFDRIISIVGEERKHTVIKIADYTGQPEMQGGLVKTLDFKIYLGLLSEQYNNDHQSDLQRAHAIQFDMVVVNLYPFAATIKTKAVTVEDARGNIDIGGPCMLRAAAKNFLRVAAVCDPEDYKGIIDKLNQNQGKLSFNTRFEFAQKAFKHTADYDREIAGYLSTIQTDKAAETYGIDKRRME